MDEKLARMDVDLKAWKSRVESRKKFAQREIDKRTQMLKEVRYYILYILLLLAYTIKCFFYAGYLYVMRIF